MFKQQKLRQQANIDYQQARGTAHKHLLQTAKINLNKRQNRQKEVIQNTNGKIHQLENERDRKLKEALLHHIIHDRLTEIPGIGQARSTDIIRHVYKGKITDLYNAHMLPGIGEQTQAAINQWVHYYQKNFTKLLDQDFPDKYKTRLLFHEQILAEEGKITSANKEILVLKAPLDRIQTELNWLEKISINDFYRKLKNPVVSVPELDHYIQGVFAEWEPMPGWFRDVLKAANVTGQIAQEERGKTAVSTHSSNVIVNTIENWGVYIIISVAAIMFLCISCLFMTTLFSNLGDKRNPTPTPTPTLTITETTVPTETPTPQPSPTNTAKPSQTPTTIATSTATSTPIPQPQVEVNISAANVRANPDSTAVIIGTVKAGDVLPVLDVNEPGTWYQVQLPNGKTGWIGSSVVTLLADNLETP